MSRPTHDLPGSAALTDVQTERLTRRGLRLAARLRHGEADEAKERRPLKAVAGALQDVL